MIVVILKKFVKSAKPTLLYWGSILVITIIGISIPNGFFDQLFSNFFENVVFWIVMSFIFVSYIVLCLYEVICDIKNATQINNDGCPAQGYQSYFVPKKINHISLNPEESLFLNTLVESKDRPWQIAVAIILKDFIEERNLAICNEDLSVYIPSYCNIREDTCSSLTSLVYLLNIVSTYANDQYYNPALIRKVIS